MAISLVMFEAWRLATFETGHKGRRRMNAVTTFSRSEPQSSVMGLILTTRQGPTTYDVWNSDDKSFWTCDSG